MEDIIYRIAISFPAFLLAIVCHEAAHAWMAKRFGDTTGEQLGRISLNPAVHYDLIGTIIFPLIGIMFGGLMFGWAKPVPVDTRRFRNIRKGTFWVSFAGSLANMSLVIVSVLGLAILQTKVPLSFSYFTIINDMLMAAVAINIALAIFNLIPIPPLDGSKMVSAVLNYNAARKYEELQQYSLVLWIILFITGAFRYLMAPGFWMSNVLLNVFVNLFKSF